MKTRRQASTVVCLALLLGCRQLIGVADPDPPLRCDASAFRDAACGSCLATGCCEALDACRAETACTTLVDCVASCADDACRATCERTTRIDPKSAAVFACQASRCGTACGLPCGGAGIPITGCKPCADACCADGSAFRASIDGQLLRGCRAACAATDAACREACVSLHVEGAHLERTANECVANACNLGSDWSCVGRLDLPRANPTAGLSMSGVNVDIQAIDAETLAPIANADVKGCSRDQINCEAPPFGTVKTSTRGTALVSVRDPSGAYPGFIEIAHPSYVPVLIWFAPPLRSDIRFGVEMSSKALFQQLERSSGVAFGADRGHLLVVPVDCHDATARGVSVRASTADGLSRTAYISGISTGGPTFDFTRQAGEGAGVVFNLPAGATVVKTRVEDLCLDTASPVVVIRPGALSFIVLPPLP
jgi:hypothetical protein